MKITSIYRQFQTYPRKIQTRTFQQNTRKHQTNTTYYTQLQHCCSHIGKKTNYILHLSFLGIRAISRWTEGKKHGCLCHNSFCQICVLGLQCILLWSCTSLLVTSSLLRPNMLLRISVQIFFNYNLLIGETQVKQFLLF